jgi:hypothetical protein
MTWSPFFTEVTPGADLAHDAGALMAEDRREQPFAVGAVSVKASVWQMPVALISTSTSPAFGPSRR